MASGRITIDVGLEASGVAKGAKDAEKALEHLEDAIADTGRAGARDLDKLEDELKDVQRQSAKAETAVDKIGGKGFKNAANASGEFKDEAKSNFSEITSSFDGSMSSIGDLAQGTLGGLANSDLPGVALAAGVAAAGIGGITTRLGELGEESDRIKEDIIADFVELGDALDQEAVDNRVRDILNTEGTRKQAQLLADILGVSLGQAVLALAGDFEAAGVTYENVVDGINNASSDVDYDTWVDLKNGIEATNAAMEAGPQIAQARAEAERRTAEKIKQAEKQNRDEIAKTADQLRGLAGQTFRPTISPRIANVSAARRQIQRDLNGTVVEVAVRGVSGRRLT